MDSLEQGSTVNQSYLQEDHTSAAKSITNGLADGFEGGMAV